MRNLRFRPLAAVLALFTILYAHGANISLAAEPLDVSIVDGDKSDDSSKPDNSPTESEIRGAEPLLSKDFHVTLKKKEDSCTVRGRADSATVTIKSPSGIGELTLRRNRPEWPAQVVLQLHLRGLEHLSIRNDHANLTLKVAVKSHSPHRVGLYVLEEDTWRDIDTDGPHFLMVRAYDAKGQEIKTLPPKAGYFRLKIPTAMLKGNPKEILIRWVDFYRS